MLVKPLLVAACIAIGITAIALPGSAPKPAPAATPGAITYRAHIMPILNKYCVQCHGIRNPADGISLATPEGIKKGYKGRPIFIPGKAEDSLMYKVTQGGKDKMPPAGAAPLPQVGQDRLKRWIDAGANFD